MMKRINIINKIFPKPLYDKLSYDVEGLWSITHPDEASLISINLVKILDIYSLSNNTILDMTAGCGGNTISFFNYFKNVIAVENNKDRFDILKNNLECYNNTNYKLINGDSLQYIDNTIDVFFIDPPWGGPNYKKQNNIELYLSDIKLIDVIGFLPLNKLVVLKLPFNCNISDLTNKYKLLLKLEIKNIIILYLQTIKNEMNLEN